MNIQKLEEAANSLVKMSGNVAGGVWSVSAAFRRD